MTFADTGFTLDQDAARPALSLNPVKFHAELREFNFATDQWLELLIGKRRNTLFPTRLCNGSPGYAA